MSIDPKARRSSFKATLALMACGCLAAPVSATDLQDVYERAKMFDATMQSALHDYDAAKLALPLARSAFRPQLGLGADANYTATDSESFESSQADGSDRTVPASDDQYGSGSLSLTLSQTLFNRANAKLVDQARLSVMQADSRFLAVEQQLILRVSTAYFDVLRAQANVDFSRRELEAIGQQREQAERRFDVGLVPITDVRSAQAQYDLAIAQEIAASNQLSAAQEALRVISGIETDELAPLAEDLPLRQPEPADINTWVETAGEQNLNLVIARLTTDSARSQVAVERSARYPTLEAVGTAAQVFSGQDDRPEGVTTAEVGLQLRVPILTGGRINAQIAQANAQALSSAELLVAEERAATQQTRDAFRGVTASISRAKALGQALVSTEQSAEAAQAGFRAGTRTSVEVLQALRDVYSARSDYIGARFDYIINTLNLKAAAGTLSEEDVIAINRFLRPVE